MEKRVDWDARYASFLAVRGFPRYSFEVYTREEAMSFLSKELAEEFAKQYPEES